MSRARRLAGKVFLSLATLAVSLLLGEAALRLTGAGAAGRGSPWFAGGSHPRFLFEPDPEAGYTLRPGFRGVEIAASGEFRVPVAIDGRGLRSHPHASYARHAPPEEAAGRAGTVLAVGDSMTFGEGLPVGQTFPALLERATGALVHNGGVPGYGSPQMAVRLARLAPALRPGLVLVTLQPTWDAGRCTHPFVYLDGYIVAESYLGRLHRIDGNLYSEETRLPGLGPASAWLKGHSHLARLALPALHDLASGLGRREEEPPPDFACSAAALARALGTARAAGAELLVVLAEAARGEPQRRDNLALEAELARRKIPVLSLDRRLRDSGRPGLRYPRDGHWNAAGHRWVAAVLAQEVARRLAHPLSHDGAGAAGGG